jgi:hypothetical protein
MVDMARHKISVTIGDSDLAWLRKRAQRAHGGNLSAAMAEAARLLRKQEALRAFLDQAAVPRLSAPELAEIQEEWRRPTRSARGARRKRTA